MSDLTVRSIALDELMNDPQNVRKHDKRNLEAISNSLQTFGQRKPIVCARGNNNELVVIAGNGTLEAAKSIGWTHIDVVEVPEEWDADKARAFAIADNRTAELATWDDAGLTDALLELDAVGYDIKTLGFDPATLDDADDVIQDDVPDVPDKPTRSKAGQLWKLGQHRLLVGDSTDQNDVARLMDGQLADCIFTDPPYNVAYQGGTEDALTIMNDQMSDDDFAQFLHNAYTAMYEHTKPGGAIYVCHADTGGGVFRHKFVETGWMLKQCLIWVKDAFVLGRQDYHWQHEPILYGWKPGAAHEWYGRRVRTTVLENSTDVANMKKAELLALLEEIAEASSIIRVDRPRRNAEHPTMKPVPLVARLVANSSKRGDIVLDPFGGSGSTLVACDQMDRTCFTIEKDERYADVIIERWENLTRGKAELEND